jgi:hypothetical protein
VSSVPLRVHEGLRTNIETGAVMTNQPTSGMGGMLPGVAAAGGLRQNDDVDESRSTDDGVPVGDADRQADAERSGAGDDDDTLADPQTAFAPDGVGTGSGSDDGVPVGADDAEADRQRTTDDD